MMKIDLSKLSIARLKAYRKSLQPKRASYEVCDCGDPGCDHRMTENKDDPRYLDIKAELERVNAELCKRQRAAYKAEKKKNWASNVLTDREYKRFARKRK